MTLITAVKKHKELTFILLAFWIVVIPLTGKNSYWLDELYSVYVRGIRYESLLEHIKSQWIYDRNHPLYEIILFVWMKLFGHTEISTRMLSVIYSSLAAWLLYLYTWKIWGKRVAVLATMLFLFSYMTIWYSLEARYYSQMLLLTTWSSWLMFRYVRELNDYKWSDLLLNKRFAWLALVNAAMILNHPFNLFFLSSQGVFLIFYMISRPSPGSFIRNILKVSVIYMISVILAALTWIKSFSFLLSEKAWTHIFSIIHDTSRSVIANLGWREAGYIGMAVLTIMLFFFYKKSLIRFLIVAVQRFVPDTNHSNQRIVILNILTFLAIILLYFFSYDFLSLFIKTLFIKPFIVFKEYIFQQNINFPGISLILFLLLLLLVFFISLVRIYRVNMTYRSIIHHTFLMYNCFILFLPPIAVFILYSFGKFDKFTPRYIIYCLPALMILISLSVSKGIELLGIISKKLLKFSLHRHYIKHTVLYSTLLTLLLTSSGIYKAITWEKLDWRGISLQIVHAVEADPGHSYIVYETTFRPVSTLNYYLKRHSTDIKVSGVIQRYEEEQLSDNQSHIPNILQEDNKTVIENCDFLLIAFTHHTVDLFPLIQKRLSEIYQMERESVSDEGRGFIVYKIHALQDSNNNLP